MICPTLIDAFGVCRWVLLMRISNGRCKIVVKFIFFCAKGKISKKGLQFVFHRDIIANVDGNPPHNKQKTIENLGVAQVVARYLGVVEAASSSLVTQTRKSPQAKAVRTFSFLLLLIF